MRQLLFPLYSFTVIGPIVDMIKLIIIYKDPVMFWHPVACVLLSLIIVKEVVLYCLGFRNEIGTY
jgi:hypothetical protein